MLYARDCNERLSSQNMTLEPGMLCAGGGNAGPCQVHDCNCTCAFPKHAQIIHIHCKLSYCYFFKCNLKYPMKSNFFFHLLIKYLYQGDSGGPLTVQDTEGSHTLVGLVSHGVSWSVAACELEKTKYEVYTAMDHFMGWMNKTILNNGGMAACPYMLTADPDLG